GAGALGLRPGREHRGPEPVPAGRGRALDPQRGGLDRLDSGADRADDHVRAGHAPPGPPPLTSGRTAGRARQSGVRGESAPWRARTTAASSASTPARLVPSLPPMLTE